MKKTAYPGPLAERQGVLFFLQINPLIYKMGFAGSPALEGLNKYGRRRQFESHLPNGSIR